MRSSKGIRAVERSSSLLLLIRRELVVRVVVVVVVAVVDALTVNIELCVSIEGSLLFVDGLFKPNDECFKCAFGLRTTRTVEGAVEFFKYSKANCGNGKRNASV